MDRERILLAHGSGGRSMHELIKGLFVRKLGNPVLNELSDSALINYRQKIAFTTDSFVVNPVFFPGGDIGKLAVCGTVNDLVMLGAQPEYISLAFIIEESFPYRALERIVDSIASAAKNSGVQVATGDTKVVEKGACDAIFINTSGIGRIIYKRPLGLDAIKPGDKIIITGNIGQHGLSVLAKRKDLGLAFSIKSDCQPLSGLIMPVFEKVKGIKFMRDPTRGGVATTLNEVTQNSGLSVEIEEDRLPISGSVKSACELLGLDPLYVANEGIAVIIAGQPAAEKIIHILKRHPSGRNARIIGEVKKNPRAKVVLRTAMGTSRLVGMLTADYLPRIC